MAVLEEGILTEEKWRAIMNNDSSYDGVFFYAVTTTGIFCRPSCNSRMPRKDNIRVFRNAEEALAADFRPCKRCNPTGRMPMDEWISRIANYIDRHYSEPLTLQTLADQFHASPYHLLRAFKRIKGKTPVEYIQEIRIAQAKEYLALTEKTVADIGHNVGFANTPYFITLFKKMAGLTPAAYRRLAGHAGPQRHTSP